MIRQILKSKPRIRLGGRLVRSCFECGLALALMLFSIAVVTAQVAEPDRPFRFGASISLLRQFNENDAKAAMKVWAEALVKEGAFKADSTPRVYDSGAAMLAALQNREVDGVTVSVSELFALQEKIKFDRFIFDVTDGSIYDEYVLLVHQDSGFNKLEDLRGRSLNVLQTARMCLATPWLDTILLEKGWPPTAAFYGRVTAEQKIAKVVLPVFFKNTDACLVTRKGFKMMGELNPQVTQQLRVLACSPKFVTSGFFLRAGPAMALQDKIVEQAVAVHRTVAGKQVLTVFQSEELQEHPASVLDSAFELLARHQVLSAGSNTIKSVAANAAIDQVKERAK